MYVSDIDLKVTTSMVPDNGWGHFVLSYTRSRNIKIYYGGELVSKVTEVENGKNLDFHFHHQPTVFVLVSILTNHELFYLLPGVSIRGNGRVVIGRRRVDRDDDASFMSMEIDELMLFNEELTAEDVSRLNSQ